MRLLVLFVAICGGCKPPPVPPVAAGPQPLEDMRLLVSDDATELGLPPGFDKLLPYGKLTPVVPVWCSNDEDDARAGGVRFTVASDVADLTARALRRQLADVEPRPVVVIDGTAGLEGRDVILVITAHPAVFEAFELILGKYEYDDSAELVTLVDTWGERAGVTLHRIEAKAIELDVEHPPKDLDGLVNDIVTFAVGADAPNAAVVAGHARNAILADHHVRIGN